MGKIKAVRWFEHTRENSRALTRKNQGLICICGQPVVIGEVYAVVKIRKPRPEERRRGKSEVAFIGAICHKECFEGFLKHGFEGIQGEITKLDRKLRRKCT